MSSLFTLHFLTMSFGERLTVLRKEHSLTQQALADLAECHVTMIRRYEANEVQPTLDVIRRLAIALSVSADTLVFEQDERGPAEDLRLQFEALSQFSQEEKHIVKALLEGLMLKHQAHRVLQLAAAHTATPPLPHTTVAAKKKKKTHARRYTA